MVPFLKRTRSRLLRSLGAGTRAASHACPLAVGTGAKRSSPTAHEVYSLGTLQGWPERPALGPLDSGHCALTGDARPRRNLALAGRCGSVSGNFCAVTHFAESVEPALPGMGMRRGGVRAQRGPRPGSDRGPCRGDVWLSPAGHGPRLGPLAGTTYSRPQGRRACERWGLRPTRRAGGTGL